MRVMEQFFGVNSFLISEISCFVMQVYLFFRKYVPCRFGRRIRGMPVPDGIIPVYNSFALRARCFADTVCGRLNPHLWPCGAGCLVVLYTYAKKSDRQTRERKLPATPNCGAFRAGAEKGKGFVVSSLYLQPERVKKCRVVGMFYEGVGFRGAAHVAGTGLGEYG